MSQNSSRQLLRVYAICLLGTFAGSFISPILRLLVDLGVDSAVITFYRMLFVSLLLVPLLLSRKESRQNLRSISPKVFVGVIAYALCRCAGLLFWAEAMVKGASAFVANTLGNSSAVFVVLFSFLFLREKTSLRSLAGIGVCLIGVMVIGSDNLGESSAFLAVLFILLSSLFNAGNTVLGRAVRRTLDLLPLLAMEYSIGALCTGVYAASKGADFHLPPLAILYLILLAWVCTLMALSIPIWALRYARPASVSVINLAGPVFTVFTGFFLLGEVPTLPMYIGAAIMILGLGYYVINEQKESLRVKH